MGVTGGSSYRDGSNGSYIHQFFYLSQDKIEVKANVKSRSKSRLKMELELELELKTRTKNQPTNVK